MRVMIASSTYAPAMNGQAVFTTNLAEGLVKMGHQVMVILDSHHVQASRTSINGVIINEIRSVSMSYFHAGTYFSPFPGKEVRRLFDEFQPEIVHIQDHYPTCRVVAREARKRRIKLVGSNHFVPENIAPYIPGASQIKPLFYWLGWQWVLSVYRHADAITAQSNASARLLHPWGLNIPIIPISCGIDLNTYFPNPDIDKASYRQRFGIDLQRKIFLFLGRIDGEKRIDLLLHTMRKLPRDDIQMVIAGHGKEEKPLKRLAEKMALQDRVRFTGFIPARDVPGLMNSIDVFVMPSEAELLSISTLEAMACGKPVLLANALALPELVKDGENGYLFKPGDMDDLVRLVTYMADHPERWPAMGAVSREITLAHSLDETLHKFQSLYLKLVGAIPVADLTQKVEEPIS